MSYILIEKKSGKYVNHIIREHHTNYYTYHLSKSEPQTVTEFDISRISNIGDFTVIKKSRVSPKLKNKINKNIEPNGTELKPYTRVTKTVSTFDNRRFMREFGIPLSPFLKIYTRGIYDLRNGHDFTVPHKIKTVQIDAETNLITFICIDGSTFTSNEYNRTWMYATLYK